MALVAVCVVYPVWFLLRGPQHYTGATQPLNNIYHGVVFGPVLPTLNYRFGLPGLSYYGHLLDVTENGQYLGVPLLILASLFVVWFRRRRGVLLAAMLAIAAYLLSLGDHLSLLTLGGSYPLPFVFIDHLPLLNKFLPVRLTLYTVLFVAVVVGLGTAQLTRPAYEVDPGVPGGPVSRQVKLENAPLPAWELWPS